MIKNQTFDLFQDFRTKHLVDDIYYAVLGDTSIFVNLEAAVSKLHVCLSDSIIASDSILVFQNTTFSMKTMAKSPGNSRIVSNFLLYGRFQILIFDQKNNVKLLQTNGETFFVGICYNYDSDYIVNIVTGYGRNPGKIYAYKHKGENDFEFTSDSCIVERVDMPESALYLGIFQKFESKSNQTNSRN